jgi:hypothetical protein
MSCAKRPGSRRLWFRDPARGAVGDQSDASCLRCPLRQFSFAHRHLAYRVGRSKVVETTRFGHRLASAVAESATKTWINVVKTRCLTSIADPD